MATIEDFLNSNLYMNVATVNTAGQPWNTPVFFAHRGKNLYWFSSQESVHSTNIANNPKVFITIYDSTVEEGNGEGLYLLASAAMQIDQDELREGIEVYNKKAQKFKISEDFVSENAPNKLYCAQIERAWINDSGNLSGDYIDVRTELKLDGND